MINIFNIALPIIYFILVWTYGKAFFADKLWAKNVKTPLLIITVISHFFYLALRTLTFQHPPVTTVFEILSLLGFSIAVTYLAIELRSRQKETGYFVLNIAFFFQLASSILIKETSVLPDVLRGNLFGAHIISALLGYAAITIGAVYGFMYLMLYHEIKVSRFGTIYKKLPTLESLERMTITAIKLAILLLGIAICVGFIWLHRIYQTVSYFDPKLIGTLLMWIMYGLLLIARKYFRIQERKVMIFVIVGFVVSIFSMTIINIFSDFHRFY